ncbi:hypothetical protein LPJ72_005964 [Coemansia sp. Benny D160-2]|nr:hypothetical protein LPJ72_005964 [Coemansia sp. Benny D160-2]
MVEIDNEFQAESVATNVKLSDPEGDATFLLEVLLHEGVVVEVKEIFKRFVKTLDSESSIVSAVVLEALFMSYAASLPTTSHTVLTELFGGFEARYCPEANIHASICDGNIDEEQVQSVLQSYYATQDRIYGSKMQQKPLPALFSSAEIKLVGLFRGQGAMDNYIEETRAIYTTYGPLVKDFVGQMNEFLGKECADPRVSALYKYGLDVHSWITNPKEELPSTEYLLSVAVSIPVVGLTQLMQIVVLYKTLGIAPGELAASFKGK